MSQPTGKAVVKCYPHITTRLQSVSRRPRNRSTQSTDQPASLDYEKHLRRLWTLRERPSRAWRFESATAKWLKNSIWKDDE